MVSPSFLRAQYYVENFSTFLRLSQIWNKHMTHDKNHSCNQVMFRRVIVSPSLLFTQTIVMSFTFLKNVTTRAIGMVPCAQRPFIVSLFDNQFLDDTDDLISDHLDGLSCHWVVIQCSLKITIDSSLGFLSFTMAVCQWSFKAWLWACQSLIVRACQWMSPQTDDRADEPRVSTA